MKSWLTRIIICLILGAITTVAVAWAFAALWQGKIIHLDQNAAVRAQRGWVNEHRTIHAIWARGSGVLGRGLIWSNVIINDPTCFDSQKVAAIKFFFDSERLTGKVGDFDWDSFALDINQVVARADERLTSNVGDFDWENLPFDIRQIVARADRFDVEVDSERGTGWPWPALVCRRRGVSVSPFEGILGFSFRGVAYQLPIRPLWAGFLADSALMSLVWFCLLGPPAGYIRRSYRRRRQRCMCCGYDLRGHDDGPSIRCPECGMEF